MVHLIDLLTLVSSNECLVEIELVSFFSALIISVCVSLLSKGEGDLVSHLEVVEACVSSVIMIFIEHFNGLV